MPNQDVVEVEGKITAVLQYQIAELENGHQVLAHISVVTQAFYQNHVVISLKWR